MEAILSYSNCAEELLKRKKVHRDVIFKYLAKEGVVIPSNSEKHQLIKKTLEFWSNATVKTEKVRRDCRFVSVVLAHGLYITCRG